MIRPALYEGATFPVFTLCLSLLLTPDTLKNIFIW